MISLAQSTHSYRDDRVGPSTTAHQPALGPGAGGLTPRPSECQTHTDPSCPHPQAFDSPLEKERGGRGETVSWWVGESQQFIWC